MDTSHTQPAPLATWLLPVALTALLAPGAVFAQSDLDILRQRTNSASKNLDELKQRFIQPQINDVTFRLEKRLQEGLVLLELGDPDRASVLFLDIVERDAWSSQPGYDRAIFYLGQALYSAKNYQSSRKWLHETLKRGNPQDLEPAISLLIEIGIRTGNWRDIDDVFARYERSLGRTPPPELLYARGKGLYSEERFDEALAIFGRVPPDTVTGLASRYFSGVIRLKQDPPNFDAALADFIAVTEQPLAPTDVPDPREAEFRDLAHLAKARIHFERDEWADALDTYQNLSRNSPFFDTALFEITWTHIRQSEEQETEDDRRLYLNLALRNLDILLLTRQDSLFRPDAQRLQGDILKDLGSYGKALDTYNQILDEFEPVLRELDLIVEGQPDHLAYFQALVKKNTVGSTQYVPRSASTWVPADGLMEDASTMVTSLGQAYDNMEESRNLIDEIEAAVNSENRYEIYPEMREAWISALELESVLLNLMAETNKEEAQLLGAASNPNVAAMRSEREELESRYLELPQNREAFASRERAMRAALEKRNLRAFRLRVSIESTESQIEAMERWLLVYGPKAKLSAEEEGRIRHTLRDGRGEIAILKDELRTIEHDLRVQGSLGGMNPNDIAREAELRKQYKLALFRERDALAATRSGGGGELATIDTLRNDLQKLDGELEAFRSQITVIVDQKTEEIRVILRTEQKNLERYSQIFARHQADVELVAGEIAYNHWRDVRSTFADLILSADIGVIDVAWLKKDRNSRKLAELKRERNKEREILKEDFEQVLQELRKP